MQRSAIALMSGGLDSNLAVRLVHDMGIGIIGVHFTGPFCLCNRGAGGCIHYAREFAKQLGIEFTTSPLGSEYIDIVVSPKHGRGSGMNPCLDCRILMFRRAKAMMIERGASFILTGEVLGQRPMSQLRDKLRIIERESELAGLILRPLSAQHMPPTVPEEEGWVDRAQLLAVRGRGRRVQMDLAEKLRIGDYPCPAGGCLLTDKPFSARLREHLDHAGELRMSDIPALKLGRHFRLPSGAKLVIGRDQEECEQLERLARENDTLFVPQNVTGPTGLIREPGPGPEELSQSAGIIAAYSKSEGPVAVEVSTDGATQLVTCPPADRAQFVSMKV